jgi:hypothetical protein
LCQVTECNCNFDAEGWREIEDHEPGYAFTRRHKPDCPLSKNTQGVEENAKPEKPRLDLSDLMNDLIGIPLRGYPEIVKAFERIQNYINQTK